MNNDAVERLAGGIAHDFDRLLTTILDHADTLADYLSPGDPRSLQVTGIRHAAEQASKLTRQLLAFSRTQTLRPVVVDLNAAAARARHRLQRVLGDRIALAIEPGDRVWPVRADAEQLDRMLHHLAVNARAAMPDGGSVVVSTANVEIAGDDSRLADVAPGDYVRLSVIDNGVEIQPTVQQHLFEPFFPALERPKASGLGLAMVYGAVKQSGGHITVESPLGADGRGSRFSVYLPAARGESPAESTPPEAATVLLLGEDRNVQSFIGDVLRRRGYRLLLANDAWDALRLADDTEPSIDLLITTGPNGLVVADVLRDRCPSTRVLHVSASAVDAPDDADRTGGPPRAVLPQPFTPAALARKVRAVLT